jgi:hypothetical protein
VSEALSRRLSGVQLKDETSGSTIQGRFANFLLGD